MFRTCNSLNFTEFQRTIITPVRLEEFWDLMGQPMENITKLLIKMTEGVGFRVSYWSKNQITTADNLA